MPWDSTDKHRDEDATERRHFARRRWNKLRGRRSSDLNKERYTYTAEQAAVIDQAVRNRKPLPSPHEA